MTDRSYYDRTGEDPELGSAIQVRERRGEVTLDLGVMRNFGLISTDAWAALSPAEARELADDLRRAADRADVRETKARALGRVPAAGGSR